MKIKFWTGIFLTLCFFTRVEAQLDYLDTDTTSFIKLMIVGDISPNGKLIESTYNDITNTYDFQPVFHYIRPVLNLGDIVACNLESTLGAAPYGMYPTYKAPEELAVALKYAGFNTIMTANEKTINQSMEEWEFQNEVLERSNLEQIGSFSDSEDIFDRNPTLVEKDGIKVSFLNYMTGADYDTTDAPLVSIAEKKQIQSDIFMAKNKGADFVVVYFHWGKEYQPDANEEQVELANYCIEAGANMIMGTHPHVVQQMFFRNYYTNDGYAEGVVAYSLGDFLSTASSPDINSACILELILKKDLQTGFTQIHDYGYIPTYTHRYTEDGEDKWTIMPVSQIERGHVFAPMDEKSQRAMQASIDKIRYKMSSYMEEVEYEFDNDIIEDVAEVISVQGRPLNEDKDFKLMDENMLIKYNKLTQAKYNIATINNEIVIEVEEEDEYDFFDAPDIDKTIYKVQFMAAATEVDVDTDLYNHLEEYEVKLENGSYKYLIGSETSLYKINNLCLDIKRLGHKDAFVVAYKNGKRVQK